MSWQPKQIKVEEPFKRISVDEAKALIDQGGYEVIDVREPSEYAQGHIPGVKLIPLNTFLNRAREYVDGKDNLIFVCAVGQRSAVASEMAAALGVKNIFNIEGGTNGWAKKGYPIER